MPRVLSINTSNLWILRILKVNKFSFTTTFSSALWLTLLIHILKKRALKLHPPHLFPTVISEISRFSTDWISLISTCWTLVLWTIKVEYSYKVFILTIKKDKEYLLRQLFQVSWTVITLNALNSDLLMKARLSTATLNSSKLWRRSANISPWMTKLNAWKKKEIKLLFQVSYFIMNNCW